MLDFLFRGLTSPPHAGTPLFEAITGVARQPHWYIEGQVPDTLDGRFALLSTICALALVRLEQAGDEGNLLSVALTERFIAVMESEHRELGQGDPTLGKTVRKLVALLGKRVDLWRAAAAGEADWTETARVSVYKTGVSPDGLLHTSTALQRLGERLGGTPLEDLRQGKLG